jgi:hypothetical protein
MVGTLSFSLLAAVASFATGVVATQCTGNNFPVTILNNDLWCGRTVLICGKKLLMALLFPFSLPKGGPKNPPGCPYVLSHPLNR